MRIDIQSRTPALPSIVKGIPLSEEEGLGALTIAGYAREVTTRFAEREALAMRLPDGSRISWTYAELWDRSVEVAKALIAAGVGKDSRVGILMTNRPEYIASLFGIALAGGVTVSLSTFSTPIELDYLLRASCVSLLLYDRQVLKKDFGAMLGELEPAILTTAPGTLNSTKFPFLRRLVVLDSVTSGATGAAPDGASVEKWAGFPWRRRCRFHGNGRAARGDGQSRRCGRALFFLGYNQPAQGHFPCAAGAGDPVVALAADPGRRPGQFPGALLDRQRLLLVRQSLHGAGQLH